MTNMSLQKLEKYQEWKQKEKEREELKEQKKLWFERENGWFNTYIMKPLEGFTWMLIFGSVILVIIALILKIFNIDY